MDNFNLNSTTEPKVIKILKRPTSTTQNITTKAVVYNSPQTNYKSYETRSEEYMKARLRILGSCKSGDSDNENDLININNSALSKHQQNSSMSTNNNSNQGVNNLSTC